MKFTVAVIFGNLTQAYFIWKSAKTPEWLDLSNFVSFYSPENQNSYKRTFDQQSKISTGTVFSENDLQSDESEPRICCFTLKKSRKRIRKTKLKNQECSICLNPLGQNQEDIEAPTRHFYLTPCKHKFHEKCLENWVVRANKKCPVCRGEIEKKCMEQ